MKETRLGCVTGRFQPVHDQHVELFELAGAECDHLLVAITNPDAGARRAEPTSAHRHTPAANPFTYYERARLLAAALAGRGMSAAVTIVPFDLTRPEVWADYVPLHARQYVRVYGAWERQKADQLAAAGYPVTVLDGIVDSKVSSTDIRRLLAADRGWAGHVPAATVPLLAEFLADRSMARRGQR